MEDGVGRLSVDEFLKLCEGVLQLFGKTRLSAEDQIKLEVIFEALQNNDQRIANVLHPKP